MFSCAWYNIGEVTSTCHLNNPLKADIVITWFIEQCYIEAIYRIRCLKAELDTVIN